MRTKNETEDYDDLFMLLHELFPVRNVSLCNCIIFQFSLLAIFLCLHEFGILPSNVYLVTSAHDLTTFVLFVCFFAIIGFKSGFVNFFRVVSLFRLQRRRIK